MANSLQSPARRDDAVLFAWSYTHTHTHTHTHNDITQSVGFNFPTPVGMVSSIKTVSLMKGHTVKPTYYEPQGFLVC